MHTTGKVVCYLGVMTAGLFCVGGVCLAAGLGLTIGSDSPFHLHPVALLGMVAWALSLPFHVAGLRTAKRVRRAERQLSTSQRRTIDCLEALAASYLIAGFVAITACLVAI